MDTLFAREVGEIENSLLSAPFSEGGWDQALRLFARRTGSSHGQLIGLDRGATLFNMLTDVDEGYQREFVEIEAWRPEVNWRVAVTGRPLEVLSERHYDAARARYGNDDYEAHVRRWGGINGCQTALIQKDGLLVGLATLRTERDGRSSRRDQAMFAAGATYALAAVRMQQAMARRGAEITAGAFDAIGIAAFLIDRHGGVAALSGAAEAIVGGGVLCLRHGRLGAARRDSDAVLQTALAHALKGEAAQQYWLGSAQDGDPGALCELFRLPRRDWDFGFEPRVLVVVRRAADIPATRVVPLRAALGLTAAEADIALALANGKPREAIAAERGTSPQTLGTQIKAILRKSDASREAELTALVNQLMR